MDIVYLGPDDFENSFSIPKSDALAYLPLPGEEIVFHSRARTFRVVKRKWDISDSIKVTITLE